MFAQKPSLREVISCFPTSTTKQKHNHPFDTLSFGMWGGFLSLPTLGLPVSFLV